MATLDARNALTASHFHHRDDCAQAPGEFRIPVKYGLRSYGQLVAGDAPAWHVGRADDCPDGTLAASIADYVAKVGPKGRPA